MKEFEYGTTTETGLGRGKNLKIVGEKAMEDIGYHIPNVWMSTSVRKFAITLLVIISVVYANYSNE